MSATACWAIAWALISVPTPPAATAPSRGRFEAGAPGSIHLLRRRRFTPDPALWGLARRATLPVQRRIRLSRKSASPTCRCQSWGEQPGALLQVPVYRLLQLPYLRVPARRLLREDDIAVHRHFELAARTRHERESAREVSVGQQEFLRRPRGACRVVSRDAVRDRNRQRLRFSHCRFAPHVSQ